MKIGLSIQEEWESFDDWHTESGRFEDTNKVFEKPDAPTLIIKTFEIANDIDAILMGLAIFSNRIKS